MEIIRKDEDETKFMINPRSYALLYSMALDMNSTFNTYTLFLKHLNLIAFGYDSSQSMWGFYFLDLRRTLNCLKLTFYHNLTTQPNHFVFFSSNLTEECSYNKHGFPLSSMTIISELYLTFMNANLNQIFVLVYLNGWESMSAVSTLADVDVNAE